MESRILHGDCREIFPGLEDESFDSVCTDPPYALNFMGKEWDNFAGYVERNGSPRAIGDDGGRHDEGYRNMRGKEKVFQDWCEQWAAECFRLLKPGGHLVAFGGTRTYHRLACAIEDAGFEIRDSLHWMYASGFPKSRNVSKDIDKAAGAAREVVAEGARFGRGAMRNRSRVELGYRPTEINPGGGTALITVPATDDAACWSGWGTALKPAHEPIVLARKPLSGTVAANVLQHGTGGLNIDACRVKHASAADRAESEGKNQHADFGSKPRDNNVFGDMSQHPPGNYDGAAGRWPPNILLTHSPDCRLSGDRKVRSSQPATFHRAAAENDGNTSAAYGKESRPEGHVTPGYGDADGMETIEAWECAEGCPVAGLDAQSGITSEKSRVVQRNGERQMDGWGFKSSSQGIVHGGTGGASRFYPQFAWSPEYDLPFLYCAKAPKKERPQVEGVPGHPTVKPLALMRWLVRLITPPGGIVLDPFAGTGTTAAACLDEGFRYVLIERDGDYIQLIRKRLENYQLPLEEI